MRRTLLVGGLLSLCSVLFTPAPASAFCGFYVSGAGAELYNNATMVVLMREGTRTVLSMQNNYQGPPSDFAMVVPVPVILSKENVKTLPRDIFGKVDRLAAPRLVEYWEQDPCYQPYAEMAVPQALSAPSAARGKAAAARDEAEYGVTVEAQFEVGEYEVVILSARDALGLESWLRDNRYKIPDGAAPLLRPYIANGAKFFVAKVNAAKVSFVDGQAKLSPLRFHYDTEQFTLPVRLGLINLKDKQDLLVHVLARNQRYDVANFPNVTIPTNIDLKEEAKTDFAAFYASLFDLTLEKHPRAVVTEYAWDSATCDPCPTPPLHAGDLMTLGLDVLDQATAAPEPNIQVTNLEKLPPDERALLESQLSAIKQNVLRQRAMRRRPGGGGFVLSRLHARYDRSSLGEDLVFRRAGPIVGGREVMRGTGVEQGSMSASVNNFQGRYAIRYPWTGPIACENPRRGVWGGPPGGAQPRPMAALDTAFAKRGAMSAAALAESPVRELGIQGRKAAAGVPRSTAGKSGAPGGPKKGGAPPQDERLKKWTK